MGELVNLNRYRKAKQRKEDGRRAAINRERSGRSRAETERALKLRQRSEKAIDDKKLEGHDDEG